MNKHTHYFWAVRIPDLTKQQIDQKITKVKGNFPFKRWVHSADYHITLAFLGSADHYQLQSCTQLVENVLKEAKSFMIDVHGINIFGHRKTPRIFWAAVQAEQELFQIQKMVHTKCVEADFVLEERSYQPHLTLARNWIGSDPFEMEQLVSENPFIEPISFIANEVVLYKSNLDVVPKYEPVATISLNNKQN